MGDEVLGARPGQACAPRRLKRPVHRPGASLGRPRLRPSSARLHPPSPSTAPPSLLCAPGCLGRKRGLRSNALGRSRGGFSTNVHAVTTTSGKPLHLALTQGQQHESTMAQELLVHAEGGAFIVDTGYDADRIRPGVRKLGMKPVIHSNLCRKRRLPLDCVFRSW
nr:transposase [Myxococcus sp. CA033]